MERRYLETAGGQLAPPQKMCIIRPFQGCRDQFHYVIHCDATGMGWVKV